MVCAIEDNTIAGVQEKKNRKYIGTSYDLWILPIREDALGRSPGGHVFVWEQKAAILNAELPRPTLIHRTDSVFQEKLMDEECL